MAEFTRDIKQLQQTAAQQPSFAPPSQSIGGDVVNLIGTGLDFYAKNQAQERLDGIAQKQAAESKQFAQGVLGFRQLRQELGMNPSLTRTQIIQKENAYVKQFSPEMGMGIVKETNTLTGTNTNKMFSERDVAERVKVTERQTLETSVAELSGFLDVKVDINADSKTLASLLLQGTANKSRLEADKSRATYESTRLGNEEKQNSLDGKLFLMEYGDLAGNQYTKEAMSIADSLDFNDSGSVQEARNKNNQFRRDFVNTAVSMSDGNGIVLSSSDVTTQLANQMAVFDEVDRILSREDIATQSANQTKYNIQAVTNALRTSKNQKERDLFGLITLASVLPQNSAVADAITQARGAALITGLGDEVFTLADRAGIAFQPQNSQPNQQSSGGGSGGSLAVHAFRFVKDIFKNASESNPVAKREAYTETILEDLQGSNAKKERLLNGGGLVTYVDAIGNGKPENVIASGKETEVLEGIMNNAGQFMRRAIPQILTQPLPMNQDFFNKPLPPKGNIFPAMREAENFLDMLDPVTLKISWKNKAGISPAVRKYNKFVDDTFKSMEKLGATTDEMDFFRSQVMEGFNVASTERKDTN
tara:strand:+ start:5879 stop:7648 length:1770 start_codon:yes stop_codon:yes gene_type:complete